LSWNWRLVRHKKTLKGFPGKKLVWYGLHEVYYNRRGKITMWAQEADVVGDNPMEIIQGLAMMLRDATREDRPILEEKDLPGNRKKAKGVGSVRSKKAR
jgi:hypothetical protein